MSYPNAETIKELNEKLFMCDFYENDYFSYLKFIESPIGDYIEYMGLCIWDSENDPRDWIDEDTQESIESFLVKEIQKISKIARYTAKALEGDVGHAN